MITPTKNAGNARSASPDAWKRHAACLWRLTRSPFASGRARTVCRRAMVIRAMVVVVCLLFAEGLTSVGALAQSLASEWVQGHNVRTRLVAGHVPVVAGSEGRQAATFLAAGLEMELADGWKTYWRIPGDAGGVPPEFDWSESENMASAKIEYPAPIRMTDRAGSTIGYKGRVVFPALITPKDATRPVKLRLMLAFGVCHDICVPSEGTYEITIPPGGAPLSTELVSALARVPVGAAHAHEAVRKPTPRLAKVETDLTAATPTVTLHVLFPAGPTGADVFVEGPVGEYVPMTRHNGTGTDGAQIFVVDLSKGADVAALKGQILRVTMVSQSGSAEATFTLQ